MRCGRAGKAASDAALRQQSAPAGPSLFLVALLAFAAGATVANLYYNQPLLALIGASFHLPPSAISLMPTATQIGYALGLLLLVPLGDAHERRQLIVLTTGAVVLMLLALAAARDAPWLLGASLLLGAATIVPQLVVPYAANLVGAERRGRTVGVVMSGLLVGVILSRSVSGFAASFVGWREIYVAAAVAMALLAGVLWYALPRQAPRQHVPYAELMRSLYRLGRDEGILQRHALIGGLGFGAFSVFWTTLIFHLQHLSPHYGSRTVGIMGFFGVAGALAAPLSGHLSDRFEARLVNGGALLMVLAAFIVFWLGGQSLAWIAAGVVLMDAGVQGSHISNQTRIYALHPEMRNRLNAVYMVTYFIGGALGSALGGYAWERFGWCGVCVIGVVLTLAALIVLFTVGHGAKHAR